MHNNLENYFVPDLCNARAIIILLAVSEALVLAMALIESSLPGFSWQRFTVMSFFVQWVCLLSVAVICPLRKVFVYLPALATSGLAIAVVAVVTLVVSVAGEYLWPTNQGLVDWWWVARNVLIGGIFASMAMRYFYVQSQWQFKTQAELNARLAALQANIRPHFFFNTLNTVSSLIAIDPDKAERMLLDLAQLFRAVLKQDDSLILLQDEIELGKRYLDIEQVRLGERMRVHWHVPEPLPAIKVPQLLLQPLLENAVYHGVAPSVDGGQIDIYVHEEKQLWRLEIHNTKVASGTTGGNRIAQANIAARLEALGQGARLQIDESAAQYRVQLWLPRD